MKGANTPSQELFIFFLISPAIQHGDRDETSSDINDTLSMSVKYLTCSAALLIICAINIGTLAIKAVENSDDVISEGSKCDMSEISDAHKKPAF